MPQNKKRQKQEVNVLEEGNIYFMYRPRVNEGDVAEYKGCAALLSGAESQGQKTLPANGYAQEITARY
jgi:hypothetical protein